MSALPTYPNSLNFKKLNSLQTRLDTLFTSPIKHSTTKPSFIRVKSSMLLAATCSSLLSPKIYKVTTRVKLKFFMAGYTTAANRQPLSFFFKLPSINSNFKHSLFAQKYYSRLRKRFLSKRKYKLTTQTSQYALSAYSKPLLTQTLNTSSKLLTLRLNRTTTHLILVHKPLYLSYKLALTASVNRSLKYLLKKSIFSFLKPNQVKRGIMQRRHKLSSLRFFSKLKALNSQLRYLLTNYQRYNFNSNLILQKSIQNQYTGANLKTLFYTNSFSATDYSNFSKKYPANVHTYSEVTLTRVKFKPGYQRLWRTARFTLAESLTLKYTYQQQFTKYISRFNRKLNGYYFSQYDYALYKIILYSKLLPDYSTFNYLWKSNNVYLNGNFFSHPNYILFEGDALQVTVSIWMYIYLRWSLMWSTLRVSKFRRLVYRKTLASSYRIMKLRKQRSNYTPLWVYNTRYDISDIKPYLETDFFTLSSVFIFNNYYYDFYTPDEFTDERHYIYRLYNWKYIT